MLHGHTTCEYSCHHLFSIILPECTSLQSIDNGTLTVQEQVYEGVTAIYNCYEGFTLFGSSTVQCQETGLWDETPPTCMKGRFQHVFDNFERRSSIYVHPY